MDTQTDEQSARERPSGLPWHYGPRQQAKAIVGALVAALAGLADATPDGITQGEALAVAAAALAVYGTVFGVEQRP